jgi:hypothetical protein
MPTRAIVCMHCGTEGEIEVSGVNSDVPPAKIFRHLGHNPFSGHMHFRCPACEIVLLVDPADVLSDNRAPLHSLRSSPGTRGRGRVANASRIEPAVQKIFRQ